MDLGECTQACGGKGRGRYRGRTRERGGRERDKELERERMEKGEGGKRRGGNGDSGQQHLLSRLKLHL